MSGTRVKVTVVGGIAYAQALNLKSGGVPWPVDTAQMTDIITGASWDGGYANGVTGPYPITKLVSRAWHFCCPFADDYFFRRLVRLAGTSASSRKQKLRRIAEARGASAYSAGLSMSLCRLSKKSVFRIVN
jgi:hypothetical protein